jgi:hypothetical protein
MSARTISKIESPTTQTIEAVKSLLAWKGHLSSPLPTDVSLENGRLVLVLSNKKDCYYVATARECSCPAATFHHGPCKHQRKFFPQEQATTKPTDSIMPERKPFRPFVEDEARPARRLVMPPEEIAKAAGVA